MQQITQRQAEYLHCIVATGIQALEYRIGHELPTNGRQPTSIQVIGRGTLMDIPIDDWKVVRSFLCNGGGMNAVNILHPTRDAYLVLGL